MPHLMAHGLLHVIRQLEKALLAVALHRTDRPHEIERPAIGADKPHVIGARHHLDEIAHGDDGAHDETFRHGDAGAPCHFGVSVGLHHARGMDREWPAI